MRVLVINPGATSTKLAVFDEENLLCQHTVEHSAEALAPFSHVIEQKDYRMRLIRAWLEDAGFSVSDMDAVCSRGGLLRHIPSGAYRVTNAVLADVENPPYGEHASNLGVVLADTLANEAGIPAFFVDPVSTDEMQDVARVSGFAGMERESFFHALNQKSVAREAAFALGRAYTDCNLIVVHMGGGVSVAAHEKGRVVDVFNVKDDGSFSMDRAGSLPVNAVINYCFSGLTKAEVKKTLGSNAGVFSYLGTRDFREVERRVCAGDGQAQRIFDALVYQHAKDIGAMAAALHFAVDAVVFTGGMANSEKLCDAITAYIKPLAPVLVFPGEREMLSLARGALRVLHGEQPCDYERETSPAENGEG